ncbi:MAG: hypothetical protein AAGM21_07360 [Pseudomonadota bacterium]
MPSLALAHRLIWFAHCPKAGGTSVETAMVARWGPQVGHLHWGWDLWWMRGGWREASPPNSPQHLIWEDALSVLPRAPDDVFALVRDPAQRMASEYRWQRRGRRGTFLGLAVSYLPFSLWLTLMLALARQNPYAYDNHLRPQTDFIPDGAKVFYLEDGLAPALDWLAETAGAPPFEATPHQLSTRAVGTTLRPRDCDRIGWAFAADYARFGYSNPARTGALANWLDRFADAVAPGLAWLECRGMI